MWSEVQVHELKTMRRCQCEELKRKLELLRTHKPSVMQLAAILRGHKAPSRHLRTSYGMENPTYEDIAAILSEKPDTHFLTITKANAAIYYLAPENRMQPYILLDYHESKCSHICAQQRCARIYFLVREYMARAI
jgi:hypothetical protein